MLRNRKSGFRCETSFLPGGHHKIASISNSIVHFTTLGARPCKFRF